MRIHIILVSLAVVAMQAPAQSVISTHAGLILSSDGTVLVDGKPLPFIHGRFQELSQGSVLSIDKGRAELLLNPAVILWLGTRGAVRMHDNTLEHALIEVAAGPAVIQSSDLTPDTVVTLLFRDWQIKPSQHGLYRIDSDGPALTVLEGEATAIRGEETLAVGEHRRLNLATGVTDMAPASPPDDLDRWSAERRESIAAANLNGMIQTGELPPKPRRPCWRRPFPSAVTRFPGRLR